jgi:hypothetical protein
VSHDTLAVIKGRVSFPLTALPGVFPFAPPQQICTPKKKDNHTLVLTESLPAGLVVRAPLPLLGFLTTLLK